MALQFLHMNDIPSSYTENKFLPYKFTDQIAELLYIVHMLKLQSHYDSFGKFYNLNVSIILGLLYST